MTTVNTIKDLSVRSKRFQEAVDRLLEQVSQKFPGEDALICFIDQRKEATEWRQLAAHYRKQQLGDFLAMACDTIAEVWDTSAVSAGQAEALGNFYYAVRADYNRRRKGEKAA